MVEGWKEEEVYCDKNTQRKGDGGVGLGFGSRLEVVTKEATQAACLHSASDQRVLRIDSCSHFQILTT